MLREMTEQGQPTPSELATFGEELRREREIRGISLKEIADATKISKRFLEAIEKNDHKTLPAPVFTRGFVREYARYLGLNAEEMVDRYNHAAMGDERIEKSAHLERLVQPADLPAAPKVPPKKKGIPPVYARIDGNLLVLVVIIAALGAAAYWAIQYRQTVAEKPVAEAPAVITPALPRPAVTEPAPQPVADDLLHLTIEATGNSWVVLDADGKTVVNDELRKGYKQTVEAKESFRFRTIGNAAGLSLSLNGLPLPPLGKEGEVVKNRVFDRDALEELRSGAPRSDT